MTFCWHRWSKWLTYEWVGTRHNYETNSAVKVTITKQCRTCDKCGKEQHRVVDCAHGAIHDRIKNGIGGTT